MSFLLGIGAILLVVLGLFVPIIIPSLLNVSIAGWLAFKASRRLAVRALLFVAFSALLSLSLRIPSLVAGDPNETQAVVDAKVVVRPDEKVELDADSEYVYFRRKSDPPFFGIRTDGSIGFRPLDTVYESPEQILRQLGIAHTTARGAGRVVLRIRSEEKGGILQVSATVVADGKAASKYLHRVRKSYPLEEFDYYGRFRSGDWRPALLYLSQYTVWVPKRERFSASHRPLRDFIQAALAQGGMSQDDKPVEPVLDPLNLRERLLRTAATVDLTPRYWGDLPRNTRRCDGEDAGRAFTMLVPETVVWKDAEIPRMRLPRSAVDGYLVMPNTIFCAGRNRFWMAAYHIGTSQLVGVPAGLQCPLAPAEAVDPGGRAAGSTAGLRRHAAPEPANRVGRRALRRALSGRTGFPTAG